MSISVLAFLFCIGFAVLLGALFAWVYNYRNLHREPRGKPQKVTDTLEIPVEITPDMPQEGAAKKRLEQEKTCYETGAGNKDVFVKKMLTLFRGRLEKANCGILSICYLAFNGEGFALRLYDSPFRISDNLFIPQSNRHFTKKGFNWSEVDEVPVNLYRTEEQITSSMAGAIVSGDGKLHGYIIIDSANKDAFSEEIYMELQEFATLTSEVLKAMDKNFKLDKENSLLNGTLKDISHLFNSSSKGNLIANLSKVLQDNFRFDRLMIITPHERDREKWQISEAVGQQKENFKGVSFDIHVKCLLYELLSGKVSVVNEKNISIDPYQRRLYENEPENLELRSLFAVTPPVLNNSYPIAIMLESEKEKAVSIIDEIMLTGIINCAALKLSDIQNKDNSKQERENALAEVDSNGLGEILNYYEKELEDLKTSEDGLGILFLKCLPLKEESKATIFENFLAMVKNLKKTWNVKHLAMLGNGEFVLSMTGNLSSDVFDAFSVRILGSIDHILDKNSLAIKHYSTWLSKEKILNIEEELGQNGKTLFLVSIANKFQEMTEVEASE
ncbi:MAG: hypothetical protein LBU89_06925 [Fibromonadaceae bacterium]|nr:hypothetical protein [Fibromonadaceae bacterium]